MLFMGMRRSNVPSHVRKNAMPRRSKMWGCQECRSLPVQCNIDRWRSGAPKMQRTGPPDYCTSTRRLRSRMYFPSLYFWDCSYALSCWLTRERGSVSRTGMERNKGKVHAHIFPAEYGLALAAIDVSHGVVACSHLTIIRFTFDNVNPAHIHRISIHTT